ncbi:hypothetical protein HI914_04207 [Erysiphe necator]|uniref:Altered inheritance of mitochondria protein 11 n=1 Tax=Uncinula necator TaxID=52586 RepID=A0A0B1P9J7_UNCNE|nr:hypothetical protein HI914_04207 [Erysiphe necator]KHJ34923.1 hypothetical protein EV44_g2740 [Erysiphe necator]
MERQESSSQATDALNTSNSRLNPFFSRSLRQFSIFAAGAGLFAVSMAITRRSIVRKYHKDIPKFFNSSYPRNIEINGAMDALEALNLATLNICSVALMTTGGMLWALDISSLDDVKKRRYINTTKQTDPTQKDVLSEQVIEDWLTSLFERKEFKALGINTSLIKEQLQQNPEKNHKLRKEDDKAEDIK